jgi:tetratricopeptide (TPR) repeat protein
MLRGMAGQIFISHAAEDDAFATRVKKAFRDADLDCWLDHDDMRASQVWDKVVPHILNGSDAVVLVFSKHAKASEEVVNEMRLAIQKHKTIAPFCLDDSTFDGEFWYRVNAPYHLGHPRPLDDQLKKLVADIAELLGKPVKEGGGDTRSDERAPPWGVRNRNRKFTGRVRLLEELGAQFGDGNRKATAVAIYGPPGFGKTELAVEYAYRHRDQYRIVQLIPAEEPSTLLEAFSSLAPALGLEEDRDQEAAVASVRARLERSEDWLLVLDNAERAEHLEPVMPQGGGGDVLITSRHGGWRGVASAVLPIEELTLDEATRFLVDRTGQEDESGAARLAERLECNPLALEHAGATIDRTQERFSEYLDQLEKDPAGTLSPVLATWKRSFEQVAQESEEAIDLLNLLAFLAPDAIPMKELELPAGAVNVLVAYSHAYRTGDNFLAVHRSVQQLARDRLTEEERTSWLDRAVDVVLEGLPADGSDILTWQRCGLLRPHVEVVRRHAEKIQTEPITLAKLLDRFAVYLRSRALFDEARHAFDEALMLVERTDGADDPLGATIRNHLGALLRDLDDLGGAQAHHEAALAIHERAYGSDHPEVANDLNELGQTLSERGDLAGARDALERAVTIHKKTLGSADRSVAEDLGALFDVLIRSGNVISARQHLEQAAGLYRDLYGPEYPDVALIEYLLDLLSGVEAEPLSEREKLEKLVGVYEKAYDRDHPQVGQLTKLLGDHLLKQGDLEGALHRYERALRIDEDTYRGTHRKVAKDLLRVFSVEAALAKRDAARTALDRAARIFQSAPQT